MSEDNEKLADFNRRRMMDSMFPKDAKGNTVYFPFGRFGDGYMITDQNLERRLRRHIDLLRVFAFGGGPALGVLVYYTKWFWQLGIALVFLALGVCLWNKAVLRNCERSSLKYRHVPMTVEHEQLHQKQLGKILKLVLVVAGLILAGVLLVFFGVS